MGGADQAHERRGESRRNLQRRSQLGVLFQQFAFSAARLARRCNSDFGRRRPRSSLIVFGSEEAGGSMAAIAVLFCPPSAAPPTDARPPGHLFSGVISSGAEFQHQHRCAPVWPAHPAQLLHPALQALKLGGGFWRASCCRLSQVPVILPGIRAPAFQQHAPAAASETASLPSLHPVREIPPAVPLQGIMPRHDAQR